MGHTKRECHFCWNCKKYGHSSKKCNNKKVNSLDGGDQQAGTSGTDEEKEVLFLNSIHSVKSEKIYLKLCLFR